MTIWRRTWNPASEPTSSITPTVSIAEAFEKRFRVPLYEGYGQTEAAPVVTLNVPAARKLGTIGRPVPGVEVAIWDDRNRVLPAGPVGEIMVRGRNVMQGYRNLP